MTTYEVTSEIYSERDNSTVTMNRDNSISKFLFKCPSRFLGETNNTVIYDDDGDLVIERNGEGVLLIEHSISTALQLVGLQVWRGAFLLADYIIHNAPLFEQKIVVELGSGVGLTSIIAGMFAKEIVCTDVNIGGILKLIEGNMDRNKTYVKAKFSVMELDFFKSNWTRELQDKLNAASIILAADVIYDDQITEAFVKTLIRLLNTRPQKSIYIALEKRFVFTISDLDSVAPMYEEFLRCIQRHKLNWKIQHLDIDFPQYFRYDRVKQLILMKIESNGKCK